jgi:hypothetical protein
MEMVPPGIVHLPATVVTLVGPRFGSIAVAIPSCEPELPANDSGALIPEKERNAVCKSDLRRRSRCRIIRTISHWIESGQIFLSYRARFECFSLKVSGYFHSLSDARFSSLFPDREGISHHEAILLHHASRGQGRRRSRRARDPFRGDMSGITASHFETRPMDTSGAQSGNECPERTGSPQVPPPGRSQGHFGTVTRYRRSRAGFKCTLEKQLRADPGSAAHHGRGGRSSDPQGSGASCLVGPGMPRPVACVADRIQRPESV